MKNPKVVELEARLEAEQRLVKYLIGILNDKMEMNEVILNWEIEIALSNCILGSMVQSIGQMMV